MLRSLLILQHPASFFTSCSKTFNSSSCSCLHPNSPDGYLFVCLLSQIQTDVASIFVTTHQSVDQMSSRMKLELRRHNYVTPTNYLELVSGYKK